MHDPGDFAPYERPRVFCASLADWLDDEVPIQWFADQLDLIRRTPHLDWLLLTKRPQNWCNQLARAMRWMGEEPGNDYEAALVWTHRWIAGEAPFNVWVGVTVEDQIRANERIPLLRAIPARVRFLSCEPLLGYINLYSALKTCWQIPGKYSDWREAPYSEVEWHRQALVLQGWKPGVDWVIAGGESGPCARPMHPDWARCLRDQCAAVAVPFLFKQWGDWAPVAMPRLKYRGERLLMDTLGNTTVSDWAGIAGSHGSTWGFEKHGKRVTGRLLDGIEHHAFPTVNA